MIDESTVSRHHLADRHVRCTESHRDDRVYVTLDAEGVEQANKGIGRGASHQVCCDPVRGVLQSPLDRYHLSDSLSTSITRRPRLAIGIIERDRLVHHLFTGRGALYHTEGVEKRLDRRAHLSSSLRDHIILKRAKVHISDISQDITIVRIHRHKARVEEVLIV